MNYPCIVIGATSSVASNVARILAARGQRLVLVGRSPSKLEALVKELGDAVIGFRALDFTDAEVVEETMKELLAEFGHFELALLAHGYLGDQRQSESDPKEAVLQISVNFVSAVAWLIPLANDMESRGSGHIAAISSVAGDRGRPRNFTYGASKGALSLYLQGLRSRLYGIVDVTTIKLGPVDSPMTVDHEKNASFVSSEEAARRIVGAIEARRKEVYVPGFWRPIMWAVRNMPEALFQRLGFLSDR